MQFLSLFSDEYYLRCYSVIINSPERYQDKDGEDGNGHRLHFHMSIGVDDHTGVEVGEAAGQDTIEASSVQVTTVASIHIRHTEAGESNEAIRQHVYIIYCVPIM
ncbi:hypothetical protein OSTOST_02944 [Ostertagia ostertagi]